MKLQRYEYIWEYYYYYYSIMNIAIESESYFWIINSHLIADCEKYSREQFSRDWFQKNLHFLIQDINIFVEHNKRSIF